MAETAEAREPFSWRIAGGRLTLGLAQGVGLYLLSDVHEAHPWLAGQSLLRGALSLVLLFVPLIVIGGLGRMRPLTLGLWALAAAAVVAAFGAHDRSAQIWGGDIYDPKALELAFPAVFFGAIFVYIGHHLVGPADAERRLIPSYGAYFDWAWKDAVQLALTLAFVGIFWASLELGAQLFKLIGISALADLLDQRWFSIPATCLAFASGVQLTDVRIALIRGVRTICLILLSWLLPLMTLIAVAFLAALPFTGLAPLFGTRTAAGTLLWAAAALIILVSAAYADGKGAAPVVLRWAARAAGIALVPLVAIAAYALWLRIQQYGLTPRRIETAASLLVGAGFAGGYAFAAVRPRGPWMRPIEPTNVAMAMVAVVVIFAVFTPVADPARLSVDDQVGRLMAGKIAPTAFDFQFLRFHAGRYGQDALTRLQRLKGDPAKALIAQRATDTVELLNPGPPAPAPETMAARFKVYPAGAALPKSFLNQDWSAASPVAQEPVDTTVSTVCFHNDQASCEAYLVDVDGDHVPEVVVQAGQSVYSSPLEIFKLSADGLWRAIGSVAAPCPDGIEALRAGKLTVVPRAGSDLELAGRRYPVTVFSAQTCDTPVAPAASPAPTK